MTKADNLVLIADYFNCFIDYLLGRTISEAEINSHNTISGNNNIIGNGNSIGEKLPEQETALIDILKKKIHCFIKTIIKENVVIQYYHYL